MLIKQETIRKLSWLWVVTLLLLGMGGAVPGFAQADPRTSIYRDQYDFGVTLEDCGPDQPGEVVALTTTFSVLYHHSFDAHGGGHGFERGNLHGEGVGLTTGNRYTISSNYTPEGQGTPTNNMPGPHLVGTLHLYTLISRTDGPGVWLMHSVSHITINANGELVVDFSHSLGECH